MTSGFVATALVGALLLGIVAGLRTFTAPAVLWLLRHGGWPAYVLGALALAEYGADAQPNTPARTAPFGLGARLISGAFCGWAVTATSGVAVWGGLLGAFGAVIGAYGGLAVRARAILLIGRVPAALLEDAVAIAGAVIIVLAIHP